MTQLVPLSASQPVLFDLHLNAIATEPEAAEDVLRRAARGLKVANQASCYMRYVLGLQLIQVRAGMWRDIQASEEDEPAQSWNDWIERVFPALTGLSRETGYGAIQIASCDALADVPEERLRSAENLSNLIALARAERQGVPVTPKLVSAAIEMPMRQFRETVGIPANKTRVAAVVETPQQAEDLTTVLDLLRQADPDETRGLVEALDELMALVGDNPNDLVMAVTAAIQHEIHDQQMGGERSYGDVPADAIDLLRKAEEDLDRQFPDDED